MTEPGRRSGHAWDAGREPLRGTLPGSAFVRLGVAVLLTATLGILAACSCNGRPQPTELSPEPDSIETESNRDGVFTVEEDGQRARLPAPQQSFLQPGQGVDVDADGRAILRFADLFTVEVVRDAELVIQELSVDEQSAFVHVLQNGGTLINDFNPGAEISRRFSVKTEFATITATGTRFLVVREAKTPLEWVVGLEAGQGQLEVSAGGVTKPVTDDVARWVAPFGEPSAGISANMEDVDGWIENVREGLPVAEVGEVVWAHADVGADTHSLADLPAPGQVFELEGVELTLDPKGLFGGPEYWLADCGSEGKQGIAIRGGIVHMDFRPVLARVRALDVTVINWDEPRTGYVAVFDPGRTEMNRQRLEVGPDRHQVLSLRSAPGEPYHYAELGMSHGCLLGFTLPPPASDGTATPTTSPSASPTSMVTATPSGTPTQRPSRTPTQRPSRTPTETPSATPTETPSCPVLVGPAFRSRLAAHPEILDELGCPIGLAQETWAAEQRFESGRMLWQEDTDMIHIVYGDGTYLLVADQWEEGDYEYTCWSEPPTEDLVVPKRGFGWHWCNTSGVQTSLGWGLEEEQGYQGVWQDFEDGHVLENRHGVLYAFHDDGWWETVE